MTAIHFLPLDTVFFRDGAQFASGSSSQGSVGGLFPPHPITMVGALRAALGRRNGWDGLGRWPAELNKVLGDGPGDLGRLSFDGPFLLRNSEPLVAAPRHLLGTVENGRWIPRTFLWPGAPVMCDLGEAVALPEVQTNEVAPEDLHPGNGWWLTASGLRAVLEGRVPDAAAAVHSTALWADEDRTGIDRDQATRTAKQGMLFTTRHVRVDANVSLGMEVHGIPSDWTLPFGDLVPVGGESRLAECCRWGSGFHSMISSLKPGTWSSGDMVALIAVTPTDANAAEALADAGLRLVSGCTDHPRGIGGWDTQEREPLPLQQFFAPGSVFFCEVTNSSRFNKLVEVHPGVLRVGTRTEWGFGLMVIGRSPDEEEGSD